MGLQDSDHFAHYEASLVVIVARKNVSVGQYERNRTQKNRTPRSNFNKVIW